MLALLSLPSKDKTVTIFVAPQSPLLLNDTLTFTLACSSLLDHHPSSALCTQLTTQLLVQTSSAVHTHALGTSATTLSSSLLFLSHARSPASRAHPFVTRFAFSLVRVLLRCSEGRCTLLRVRVSKDHRQRSRMCACGVQTALSHRA